jgi:hypothetical protein
MPNAAESLQSKILTLRIEIEWIKASRGEDPQAVLEHLRRVQSELSACRDLIREPRFECAGTTAHTSGSEYRVCLQRLQEALPILQSGLLAQRSQLEPLQEHVDAAGRWLQCNKTTLP